MDNPTLEERLSHWQGLSYSELVAQMLRAKEEYEAAKRLASVLWNEYTFITDQVIPRRMDEDDIQNITVKLPNGEKKQLLVLDNISVKTPPEKKVELWEWLRGHGAEHLITETVNSSTLAGFVREQMRNGDEYPGEICDISTYSRASLRKA